MIIIIVLIILGLSALLAAYELVSFKESSKKAAVLDIMTALITAVIVVLSFVFNSSFLLDIALVYTILSFTAILLAARYLERGI